MNNYNSFFSRGAKYLDAACVNWDKRRSKLISAWVNAESDYTKKTARKERINKIIYVIEDRFKTLSSMIVAHKEKQEKIKIQGENQIILLECPDFDCMFNPSGIGVGVRIKDYEPGKYRCELCGKELMIKDAGGIDEMLLDLGIYSN